MPTPTDIFHPVAIALVMVNYAEKYNIDIDTCLTGTGIEPEHLHDPEHLINRGQELRLVENLVLALPDQPALGFELGLQYKVATFGIWGFALRISRTLREMATRGIRYLPLSTAYCEFSILSTDNEFGLLLDEQCVPGHLREFLLERDMATSVNLIRELGFEGIPIRSIEFKSAENNHASRIKELCSIEPLYDCTRNAVVLDKKVADMPLPMYDPNLVRLLEEQCQKQLNMRQIGGVAGKLRQLLLGPIGLSLSLEDAARQLAMSPRNLRRKLKNEKTSFREVVEAERQMLAKQLLGATDMKVEEIAMQLGYTEVASFNRAFRRWFSASPGEYRRTSKLH